MLPSVCREQPPCEWRDTPRPVLPYLRPPGGPGEPASGPLHTCPSVQRPLGTEGLQSPTLSTPTPLHHDVFSCSIPWQVFDLSEQTPTLMSTSCQMQLRAEGSRILPGSLALLNAP